MTSGVCVCLCAGEREETPGSTSVPVHELMAILNAARKQYLEVIDSSLPSVASCLTERLEEEATSDTSGMTEAIQLQHTDPTEPPQLLTGCEAAPPENELCFPTWWCLSAHIFVLKVKLPYAVCMYVYFNQIISC